MTPLRAAGVKFRKNSMFFTTFLRILVAADARRRPSIDVDRAGRGRWRGSGLYIHISTLSIAVGQHSYLNA